MILYPLSSTLNLALSALALSSSETFFIMSEKSLKSMLCLTFSPSLQTRSCVLRNCLRKFKDTSSLSSGYVPSLRFGLIKSSGLSLYHLTTELKQPRAVFVWNFGLKRSAIVATSASVLGPLYFPATLSLFTAALMQSSGQCLPSTSIASLSMLFQNFNLALK